MNLLIYMFHSSKTLTPQQFWELNIRLSSMNAFSSGDGPQQHIKTSNILASVSEETEGILQLNPVSWR